MRKLLIRASVLAALVIGCLLLCQPARAASADALRLYAGANTIWLDGPGAEWPVDFEATGNAAASLSPHITLTGGIYYGFGHSYLRYDGGARVTATDVANPDFDIFLGLEYRGGSIDAFQPSEWAPYAGLGWRPKPDAWPNVTVGAKSSLGLTTDRTNSTLFLRYMLPLNLLK